MSNSLNAFFEHMRALLQAMRFSEMTGHFDYPVAVYYAGRPYVFHDPETLEMALHLYWEDRLGGTDVRIKGELDVEAPSGQDRMPVIITWRFYNWSGDEVGHSRVRYFITAEASAPKIAMIEYLEASDLPRMGKIEWNAFKR